MTQRANVPLWTVPPLWPDGECVILGGGPSLSLVNLDWLQGRRVIAVNNAMLLGSWDVMYFGDKCWFDWNKFKLHKFGGLKVTTCQQIDWPDVKVVFKVRRPEGTIARRRDKLMWNLSSGACAINLAFHFGVKRIILLGFDLRRFEPDELLAIGCKGTADSWHGDHKRPPVKTYDRFIGPLVALAADLKKLGVEVINATPGSALTAFPIVEPREVLA